MAYHRIDQYIFITEGIGSVTYMKMPDQSYMFVINYLSGNQLNIALISKEECERALDDLTSILVY